MKFEVSHRTVYRYSQPVSISHHLLHLTPRPASFQRCGDFAIEISPPPSIRAADVDYFGNPTTFVTIQQTHRELVLHALSMIDVTERPVPAAVGVPARVPAVIPRYEPGGVTGACAVGRFRTAGRSDLGTLPGRGIRGGRFL